MKHYPIGSLLALLGVLWASLTFVGCRDYARNFRPPVVEAGTFRARALLTVEQRRTFDKFYLEALRQKLKGNEDAAFELLNQALTINPNASEALYEQSQLLLQLDLPQDSDLVAKGDAMLLKAYQLEPENPFIRKSLALRWIAQKKYARAAHIYEEITAQNPQPADLNLLVNLHAAANNFPAALAALDRLTILEGNSIEMGLQRFNLYDAMGDKTRAYQSIIQLCEEHPDDLSFRVMLGDLYLKNGYDEPALAVYGDVLTTNPGNAQARLALLQYDYKMGVDTFHQHFSRLMCDTTISTADKIKTLQTFANEALQGRFDKKRLFQHFREALSTPQDSPDLGELAIAYAQSAGVPNDSLEAAFRAVLEADPEQEQARLQVLRFALLHRNIAEAAQLCRDGIALHPHQVVFYYYGGIALISQEQPLEAIAWFRQGAQQLTPANDAEIASELYAALGDVLYQQGLHREAFTALDSALVYNPENVNCLNNFAYYLSLSRTQLTKAAAMSAKAIGIEPDNPTYLDTHAWVLYRQRRYPEAKRYIDKVLDKIEEAGAPEPEDANLYDHAGDIYFRLRKRREAVELWRTAQDLATDAKLLRTLRRKIKNKRI